ncbi:unnamed protein product [Ceratitis capitata]|uniref:peptidylprolyl isomerase n=1 Tax=Ceratitis capitata TaxID=7213 RepID=A0A811USU8_CERCA|nr:unnamed protein product [Ceratitis capitata]
MVAKSEATPTTFKACPFLSPVTFMCRPQALLQILATDKNSIIVCKNEANRHRATKYAVWYYLLFFVQQSQQQHLVTVGKGHKVNERVQHLNEIIGTEFAKTKFDLESNAVSTPKVCEQWSKNCNMLTVHYTGKPTYEKKFDSSFDSDRPFTLPIGPG